MTASDTEKKRPGRPRIHATPYKLGIRFAPALFLRMDEWLKTKEPKNTQRAFLERSVGNELDRCERDGPPEPEGDHHHDTDSTSNGATSS